MKIMQLLTSFLLLKLYVKEETSKGNHFFFIDLSGSMQFTFSYSTSICKFYTTVRICLVKSGSTCLPDFIERSRNLICTVLSAYTSRAAGRAKINK